MAEGAYRLQEEEGNEANWRLSTLASIEWIEAQAGKLTSLTLSDWVLRWLGSFMAY